LSASLFVTSNTGLMGQPFGSNQAPATGGNGTLGSLATRACWYHPARPTTIRRRSRLILLEKPPRPRPRSPRDPPRPSVKAPPKTRVRRPTTARSTRPSGSLRLAL
jgi:hypothetical protein